VALLVNNEGCGACQVRGTDTALFAAAAAAPCCSGTACMEPAATALLRLSQMPPPPHSAHHKISGGKDSCYSMLCCAQHGHEVVALANLLPPDPAVDELDSYMYQTVGHQLVEAYAACTGLPLYRRRIEGGPKTQVRLRSGLIGLWPGVLEYAAAGGIVSREQLAVWPAAPYYRPLPLPALLWHPGSHLQRHTGGRGGGPLLTAGVRQGEDGCAGDEHMVRGEGCGTSHIRNSLSPAACGRGFRVA